VRGVPRETDREATYQPSVKASQMADPMRDYLEQREKTLEARVDALWKALAGIAPFARHTNTCGGGDGSSQCQCGYAAAWSAVQEAKVKP
jgi:hypothetical protein